MPGVTGVELSFDVMTPEERQALTQKLRGGAPDEGVIRLPARLPRARGRERERRRRQVVALREPRGRLLAGGHEVGLLDADIYGHSIPHILGIHQKPVAVDQMIVPPVKDGLKLMSIGFFLETSNEPVMWRGPMLHRALEQFLTDVHWGEIDTLVVDMPPGTGDVSISLGQLLPRAEVVVVTTPQKLAQDVAARAAAMAQKTNMRLLGVVENMSGDVFGSGGGEELAARSRRAAARHGAARPAAARAGRRRRAGRLGAARRGGRAGDRRRSRTRSRRCAERRPGIVKSLPLVG